LTFQEIESAMGFEAKFESNRIALGLKCRSIRRSRKISQSQMMALSNIGESRVSNIERGKSNIEFETLYKLKAGLKVEIAELLNFVKEGLPLAPSEKFADNGLENEKNKFSKRLAQLLDHRSVNQRDLSIMIKMGEGEVSNFVNGMHNMEFLTIVKIAEALKVEVFTLFDYGGTLPENTNYKQAIIS
jgi:transcriptional regulator with XRE-family HTH domain